MQPRPPTLCAENRKFSKMSFWALSRARWSPKPCGIDAARSAASIGERISPRGLNSEKLWMPQVAYSFQGLGGSGRWPSVVHPGLPARSPDRPDLVSFGGGPGLGWSAARLPKSCRAAQIGRTNCTQRASPVSVACPQPQHPVDRQMEPLVDSKWPSPMDKEWPFMVDMIWPKVGSNFCAASGSRFGLCSGQGLGQSSVLLCGRV